MIYWFAPNKCETAEFCRELQREIQRRIQTNINTYNYENEIFNEYDSVVHISEKVRKRINVNRTTIDINELGLES